MSKITRTFKDYDIDLIALVDASKALSGLNTTTVYRVLTYLVKRFLGESYRITNQ